ncbi:MAG: response regulator transcription factor [Armatimonadetes bacterium]|nr:response regulator transcription factor [Armatimonadota bacterium]
MRVLLVEDEEKVASFIRNGLREEGYAVDVVYDGQDGLDMAESFDYDVIVLDLMLPGRSGLDVLTKLRQDRITTPVMVLTAKDSIQDKVKGLDSGCDDYLTKPFSFDEFLARMRALLRRCHDRSATNLVVADLVLDPVSHKATRDGKPLNLTAKEYALLEYLMRNAGRVISRAQIAEHVWDISFDTFTNVIDVHINHLRRKVDGEYEKKLIQTVRGMGYTIENK